MRVIVLFALAIAAAAAFPANPQRIIGGSVTTISEYPSMVALLYSSDLVNYSQACGGSLLNRRSILTAAHCVYGSGANRWRSRVGSSLANSGGIVYPTSLFNIFPNYNSRSRDNDIAILRTATTIVLNENATAVSIAGSNYNLADNQVVWAAGWGYTSEGGSSSEQLLHVQIWTINQVTCKVIYPSLTENMLCSGWLDVGGRDQCQGDSGGPLYHNGIQVGIASFGEGCGLPLFPGVNTRVSRYTNWITSNA